MPASEQLERVLYVLAAASRADGVTFEQLTRALRTDVQTIVEDLNEATSRVYSHPAGTVDPFEITIEADRVHVFAPSEFNRPVRLNEREALALGLGLRVLASEAEVEQRAHILALAERLERDLKAPEIELQPAMLMEAAGAYNAAGFDASLGEDDLRSVFADAIEQRRICVIEYMKPHGEPSARRILPRRLIYANGHWYVAALDVASEESRVFRLDRVLTTEIAERMPEFAAVGEAASEYVAEQFEEVAVRYSGKVARWIAEHNGGQVERDGSTVVTHRVSDVDWLVRHVLQYGGEAVVVTPEFRKLVAERVRRLCA